ncbi:hypothetical protein HYX19_02870 [Candidatus Woesearchaeota archaeon]|nr:hypothetical protein [Candidatus Woesearchaeota archaeon]
MKGLENKLKGVSIGDLLSLKSYEFEVVGFVTHYDCRTAVLSHENPFSGLKVKGLSSRDAEYRINMGVGDKTYNLSKFESFEIIRSAVMHQNQEQ